MAKAVDRTAFLSDPTRFKIAELCSNEARSLEEIASSLGRASGSLSQPETMRKRKVLLTSKRKGADGRGGTTVFHLNPRCLNDLAAARARQRPQLPIKGQDLLLIPLAEMSAACAAIASGIDEIEWAAELSGESVGLLLAPSVGSTGSSIRILSALGEAGKEARRLHLKEVMSPTDLRKWSTAVGQTGSGKELPSGQ